MSNNHKNSICPFAEQVVSYLYDEASQAENYKFRVHLETCPPCADELESFGFVRASVSEWRETEFSQLPTPVFAIPNGHSDKPLVVVSDSTENRSWLAEFRRLFTFNPATAMAAFGILTVCIGLFWFAFKSGGNNEVAENPIDKNIVQAVASPTVEIVKKPEIISDTEQIVEKSSPKNSEIKSKNEIMPTRSIVKVSGSAPRNNVENPIRKPETTTNGVKKISPVRKLPIPNLDGADDDADETIRLADLFAELDTK